MLLCVESAFLYVRVRVLMSVSRRRGTSLIIGRQWSGGGHIC